jgi:hypothetical protein
MDYKYVAWRVDDVDKRELRYFPTRQDMWKDLNMSSTSKIEDVCNGKRCHVHGWRIAFLDDEGKAILHASHMRKNVRASKWLHYATESINKKGDER